MTVQDNIEMAKRMMKLLKLIDKLTDRVIALEEDTRLIAVEERNRKLQEEVDKLRNK